MINTTRGFLLIAVAACAVAADEPRPTAESIIDKYLEVTGGKAAYEKMRSRITKGTVEFAGKGIKGTAQSYATAPNQMYTVIDLPGLGKIEEGVSGDVAWSKSAMQGPRVKQGEERAQSLRLATFNGDLHWHNLYSKAEVSGAENVDGKDCYKIVMTPKEGKPQTRYYDKKTGLMVKTEMLVTSPMGDIKAESTAEDYKPVQGILMPHLTKQKVAGQEIQMTVISVEYNADIPKDRFDLPPDVKALLKK